MFLLVVMVVALPSHSIIPLFVRKQDYLIIQHHNEVRNPVDDLVILVWGRVIFEPVVRDASVVSEALITKRS